MSHWIRGAKPPEAQGDFASKIAEAARAQYRFVMDNRDRLIEAWVAETGLMPSESMLVEQRMDDGTIRVWVERQPKGLG